jgi:hypothetical protein
MKKITFAPGEKIRRYQAEVDELILAIAHFMIEPGEDAGEWASSVFVTDESYLGDLLYPTGDLKLLAERLGVPQLRWKDSIADIAETLHQVRNPN